MPGDQIAHQRRYFSGVGVFEVDDLVAGIRVGAHIEASDELVEKGMQSVVGDDDDLVGAIVGVERGARAELLSGRTLEDRAHLVREVGGLGVDERVEFWIKRVDVRLVEFFDEDLNPLQGAYAVRDQ